MYMTISEAIPIPDIEDHHICWNVATNNFIDLKHKNKQTFLFYVLKMRLQKGKIHVK